MNLLTLALTSVIATLLSPLLFSLSPALSFLFLIPVLSVWRVSGGVSFGRFLRILLGVGGRVCFLFFQTGGPITLSKEN